MKYKNVASFLLVVGDKFLAEKRKDTKKYDPGKIIIPGGCCEDGESLDESLRREMLEELTVIPTNYF